MSIRDTPFSMTCYISYGMHSFAVITIPNVTYTNYCPRYTFTIQHDQKYVETCSSNISFQNHGHYYGVCPPFAAITASTLLGRLSTRCWNIAAGTCFHSTTRALVRSSTDVGRLGLARSRRSNSSQRFSMGLKSGLCAGQLSSSTLI
jgi:hypothetical protein